MHAKKSYSTPVLTQHGNFATLTQQGGGNAIDVPQGTVVAPGSSISSVTS